MKTPSDIFIHARLAIVNDAEYTGSDISRIWTLLTACNFLDRAQAHLGIEGSMHETPFAEKLYKSMEQTDAREQAQ